MKKLLFLLLLTPIICFGQIIKFRSEYIAIKLPESTDIEWSDWESSNVLITLDIENKKLNIYSKVEQEYFFTSSVEKYFRDDRDIAMFEAIDINNKRCIIEFVNYTSTKIHLYIRWSNVEMVYQIKEID